MRNLTRRQSLIALAGVTLPPTTAVAAAPLITTEAPHEKLRRLSWEIADLLDSLDDPRVEYVTIHSAQRAGKAAVFTSFDLPMPAEPVTADPLVDAISSYRAGLEDFNRFAAADKNDKRWAEYGAATYEPWQHVLDNWQEPARTRESALTALQASLADADGLYGTPAAKQMVLAAIGYLEGQKS